MPTDAEEMGLAPDLHWVRRAIVVVDVVESVRLMQASEAEMIRRWREFVDEVRSGILPPLHGRLVKSLGDGMLMEFVEVHDAIAACLQIQRLSAGHNSSQAPDTAMHVRTGAHVAPVVIAEDDIFGVGVNLAARLATLAGPGEIIVSAELRDELVPELDADVEDLGECHLRHVDAPVRAFRVGPLSPRARLWTHACAGAADRVGLAIVPFRARAQGAVAHDPIGEALADDLIAEFSRQPSLRVTSRLSTTACRRRHLPLRAMAEHLHADYVVYGSTTVRGDRVLVHAQLGDGRDESVLWADHVEGSIDEVFSGTGTLIERLVSSVSKALFAAEVRRACTLPLPTLHSYTVLLGALTLMHRLSRGDFERARDMLEHLVERHPRSTAPRAWLAKWHVMRVAQGWSPDAAADAREARSLVGHALELEPTHALALAIDGLVCAYIRKDLATAGERYESALDANPSESLAWLFQSAWHAYHRRGAEAVQCAMTAQRLSPLDPLRYYYDNFTSTAMLAADDYEGAIRFGQSSLRANRTHGPTLRVLAIAQSLAGKVDEARVTVGQLRALEPSFTLGRFLERYPGQDPVQTSKYVDALRVAGLPA